MRIILGVACYVAALIIGGLSAWMVAVNIHEMLDEQTLDGIGNVVGGTSIIALLVGMLWMSTMPEDPEARPA